MLELSRYITHTTYQENVITIHTSVRVSILPKRLNYRSSKIDGRIYANIPEWSPSVIITCVGRPVAR